MRTDNLQLPVALAKVADGMPLSCAYWRTAALTAWLLGPSAAGVAVGNQAATSAQSHLPGPYPGR